MNDNESILELSFRMGETLLENGAEISRVQETMERVSRSYNVEDFNVYVLTNGIFANGTENGVEKRTEIGHIPGTSIHFGRICAVNQLSREIAEGKHTVPEAFRILEEIRTIPYSSLPLSTLACMVGSAAFGYLFGGSGWDALAASLCGLVLEPFLSLTAKWKFSKFMTNLSASALMALCAALLLALGLGENLDKIIIGSIIRLVPGVALTTSIRDFFNGDYLSGTIRMIEAVLVGGCIAIGVGVVLLLLTMMTGGALL